jgi:sulfur carrier protein
MANSLTTPVAMTGRAACIYVNDRPRPLAVATSVAALVHDLGLVGKKGVAVAVNGNVVPRSNWPEHALAADDRVLVIQATQGG